MTHLKTGSPIAGWASVERIWDNQRTANETALTPLDITAVGDNLFITMAGASIWKLDETNIISTYAGSGRENIIDVRSFENSALAQTN
jgi:hypothetical protein